jgi:hypothetical protein
MKNSIIALTILCGSIVAAFPFAGAALSITKQNALLDSTRAFDLEKRNAHDRRRYHSGKSRTTTVTSHPFPATAPVTSTKTATALQTSSTAISQTTSAAASTPAPVQTPSSIWQPAVGSTYQIMLSDVPDTNTTIVPDVEIFDIDMFNTPAETIAGLKSQGKSVICYFSAGTAENWRPDFDEFTSADLGPALDGWPGEWWLNTNSQNVRNIMEARIQLAASKGCDAVDPDNMGISERHLLMRWC